MVSLPKYLAGDLSPKDKSKRQEKKTAKRLGGMVTLGSGNKHIKGDVSAGDYRVECKRTDKESISIKREWLLKIKDEAFADRVKPALEIEIQDESWIMIPVDDFWG